ncbi:MAG: FtsX-like permease family protein [Candidatus Hodarchaeales archaeon]
MKKIMRDLRKNRSRSLPILILIIVSQVASILYIEVGVMMNATWQDYYQQTNVGDVWIDTVPITPAVYNSTVTNQWKNSYSIKEIQPRLFFKGQLVAQTEKVPVDIITLPADKAATVNSILTTDDTYFTDHSEILNGVYIEQSYLVYYNLEVGNQISLTVNFGIESKKLNLTILGGAFSPEYPLKPGESTRQFDFSATFAQYITMSIFLRLDYLQKELFQDQVAINQICVSLTDKSETNDFIRYLQSDNSALNRVTIDVRGYPALMEDMIILMIGVGFGVAFFFLIISMFLTYTVVNRFIDEQRPQIGVLKSLGYSNRYLLRRNLLYGLILGLIGSIIGNIIGGSIGILLGDLMLNSWLSFPYALIAVPLVEGFLLILITVLCSLLACFISARRILRISPQAAIKPAFTERRVASFAFERFIQKILQLRLSVSSKYSIRNVFTSPKRTLTTIFSLLMAVALFGGVFTIIDSIVSGGSLMFESENWDAQILLTHPQNYSSIQSDILDQFPISDSITLEPLLIDFAKIRNPADIDSIWTKITFTSLPTNPRLKILANASSGFLSNDSAIISPDLAQRLGLEIGESYSLQGRNGTELTISIQSILPQHHVSSFYIPLSVGNYLSFGNNKNTLVSGVLLSTSELSENNLTFLSDEYAIILKSDLIAETETWYSLLGSILSGLLVIILLIAGIIIYSIMTISISDRRNDLMIMKAVGIQNRSIYLWGLLETAIYSLIASAGYFLGYYISIWYMGILQSLMQQPQSATNLSLWHYIVSLIFGFIAACMGQMIALHFVLKQRIAEVTKEKMFG